MKIRLFIFLFVALSVNTASAAIWYVRPSGGTPTQCTGLVNADYSGSGTSQPCAFNHPWYVTGWRDGNTAFGTQRWAGGDTLQFAGSPGTYKIGYDTPFSGCSAGSSYNCHMREPPSGTDATHKTKILGYGYNPAASNPCAGFSPTPGPPRITDAFQITNLWGTGNMFNGIIYLGGNFNAGGTGAAHVQIACLDITDHDPCIIASGSGPVTCGPDRSLDGIKGKGTNDIELDYVNVHGMSQSGLSTPGASNWTVDHLILKNNGLAGWNFASDNGDADNDIQTTGTFKITNWSINFSGCSENWPSLQTNNCTGQINGENGYNFPLANGDAIAFPDFTGIGQWEMSDGECLYNMQDCFDGLHAYRASDTVHISYSRIEGNLGQAIKFNATSTVENSFIIGDCNYSYQRSTTLTNFPASRTCRAQGIVFSFGVGHGQVYKILNTTVYSIGDVAFYTQGDGCTGLDRVVLRNDNVRLGRVWSDDSTFIPSGGDKQSTFWYLGGQTGNGEGPCANGSTKVVLDSDYINLFGSKGGAGDVAGQSHSRYTDPLIVGPLQTGPGTYSNDDDLYTHFFLSSTSPLRFGVTGANSADETVSFFSDGSVDFNHVARTSNWDGGAVQYGSTPSCVLTGNLCSNNGACCSSFCCTGRCSGSACCAAQGGSCTTSGDCCSPNTCQAGACQPACGTTTAVCTTSADCCSGLICTSGTCQAQGLANGSSCGANADCLSGVCDCNHLCAAAACSTQTTGPVDLFVNGNIQCSANIKLK